MSVESGSLWKRKVGTWHGYYEVIKHENSTVNYKISGHTFTHSYDIDDWHRDFRQIEVD
jgi:hypothetical protein